MSGATDAKPGDGVYEYVAGSSICTLRAAIMTTPSPDGDGFSDNAVRIRMRWRLKAQSEPQDF